jgi:DNA repair exonuclease SbcCD nuclease subunit
MYFISDAHVREQMYTHRPLIKGDFYRGLMQITTAILDDSYPGEPVVFTGDNMHFKKVFARDADFLKMIISTFTETGHPVYGIQGNHDLNEGVSWIEVCGGIKLDDDKAHKFPEGTLMGYDYTPGETIFTRLEDLCRGGRECDILVLHQPFKHNCAWDAFALDVDDIPDCVRKGVVSGHIHTPEIRLNTQGLFIASIGATVKGKFGDKEGTYARYTLEKGFEHIPTPGQRPMYRWRIQNDVEREEIIGALKLLHTGCSPEHWPIVEITFVDGYPNDTLTFKPYEEVAHLFYSTDLEQAVEENTAEAMTTSLTWEGILPKCTKDPEVISEVSGLLRDISGGSLKLLSEKMKRQREELKNVLKES